SPVVDDVLRQRLGEAAVQVAKACLYRGAGTVEFIYDGHDRFYFLEMNTRLQVEHPVTECVTGLDLVAWQIKIAEGAPLTVLQQDVKQRGHAIEFRVYAEDPFNQFLPNHGVLSTYTLPHGPGIRVDDAYVQGSEVGLFYDPMIAKLIAYGDDRQDAIEKLKKAVADYHITGVTTTLSFAPFLLNHPLFLSGNFNTQFIQDHFQAQPSLPPWMAYAAAWIYDREVQKLRIPG
ncbi:MAG TPA: acetyl-CoA carboxylase biotin carboxylase subunit, partial [Saprospiraceae bacterium]|nr:acetyl-CoA carboxylase biotin carboxylase subunit [Saprospiraceae bacterium]